MASEKIKEGYYGTYVCRGMEKKKTGGETFVPFSLQAFCRS
jgi:hypothetical protein